MADADWDTNIYDHDYIIVGYSYFVLTLVICIVTIFILQLRKHNALRKGRALSLSISRTQDTAASTTEQQPTHVADDSGNVTEIRYELQGNNMKMITAASMVAMLLYLLSTLLISFVVTKWALVDEQHGIESNAVLLFIAVAPYFINILCLLFFILAQRLNRLLGNKCLHITSYVLPVVSLFVVYGGTTFGQFMFPEISHIISQVAAISTAFFLIIYLVFGILYLRQVAKIMRVRIEMNMSLRYIEMSQQALAKNENTNSQAQDEVIVTFETIQETVRCAFLVLLCALSNLLTPIATIIGSFYIKGEHHVNPLALYGVLTDCFINTLCVFLLFGFAESYYLCICGSCHHCSLNTCVKRVIKGFKKKNLNSKYTDKQYVSLIIDHIEQK